MIKSKIEIDDNWEKCEELYNKLKRVMNLREGYKMLEDDYRDEDGLINNCRKLINVNSYGEVYFAEAFNNLIINYVTKKPEPPEE